VEVVWIAFFQMESHTSLALSVLNSLAPPRNAVCWPEASKYRERKKAVTLASGSEIWLHPLIRATHKHLSPLSHELPLFHHIRQTVGANINNILAIASPMGMIREHTGDALNCLGSRECDEQRWQKTAGN
jgi:hypothetical protein